MIVFVLLASICWQVQEALRTVFVSHLRYDRAIGGDALSYGGQALVIACIAIWGTITLKSVFLAIMLTSLLAAAVQGFQIRLRFVGRRRLRAFGEEVWTLGRWSVLAKLVAFFSLQAFPWVLAYRHGLASVAAFQSLFQLVALSNPILLSANNLIMASIAKSEGRPGSRFESAKKYILYSSGTVGLYFAVLLLGGGRIMGLFYGRYSAYVLNAPLLRLFVAAYALEFVSMFAGALLAGMKKTQPLFFQQLCGMLIAVLVVLPWIAHSGLIAAVAGLLLVNGAKALAGWYMVYADGKDTGKRGSAQRLPGSPETQLLSVPDDIASTVEGL